jgi:hypothetical protein
MWEEYIPAVKSVIVEVSPQDWPAVVREALADGLVFAVRPIPPSHGRGDVACMARPLMDLRLGDLIDLLQGDQP